MKMQNISNIISKRKYLISIVLFMIWIFFDERGIQSYIKQKSINSAIQERLLDIEKESNTIKAEIKGLQTSKDSIEKCVRENFYMKKPGEVIYIIK